VAEIIMPRLSDTMEEGTIVAWHKQPGDKVERGDVLAEIETDKATMDLEAYDAGVLEQIVVPAGETVPIGTVVALVGSGDGAATGAPASATTAPAKAEPQPALAAAPAAPAPAAPRTAVVPAGNGERVKASPMARAIARDLGVDLGTLTGSGPGGRIVKADVESVLQAPSPAGGPGPAPAPAPVQAAPAAPTLMAGEDDEEVPLTNVRKVVARRLVESMQSAPHFYLTSVIDAEALVAFRAELNQRLAGEGIKLSVNDLIVRACATALRANPEINVSWGGDKILRHRRIHLGIAVALDEGLIVPVVRDADQKSVTQISREAKVLVERARAGKLTPQEFQGGTFTISNLGMFGIDHFTAVINPPEAAILAVGATTPEPVVRDGRVVVRHTIKLTLSIDHRALDGAAGARFMALLKAILEDPLRIVA
jgi:pyruvate dehydrogenase E2 component (dihydrolipoyllysine-residue acetyltransferase)